MAILVRRTQAICFLWKISTSTRAYTAVPSQNPNTPRLTPHLTIFHNPLSINSLKLLEKIHDAQTAYPNTKFKQGAPLDLQLTILERLPTAEELQDMYSLLDEGTWTVFLKPTPADGGYRAHPTSARSLLDALSLMQQQARKDAPNTDRRKDAPSAEPPEDGAPHTDVNHPLFGTDAFHWPVVVSWHKRRVALGAFKPVQRLLKDLAHDRDGVILRTQEQIKSEEDRVRRARWDAQAAATKERSPPEDDTLEWFKQSSRPFRRRPE